MTLNQLASKIAKIEGKKSQARIGDIREILGILADLVHSLPEEKMNEPSDPFQILWKAGRARAKRRKK